MFKNIDCGDRWLGFVSWLWHLFAMWPWAACLTFVFHGLFVESNLNSVKGLNKDWLYDDVLDTGYLLRFSAWLPFPFPIYYHSARHPDWIFILYYFAQIKLHNFPPLSDLCFHICLRWLAALVQRCWRSLQGELAQCTFKFVSWQQRVPQCFWW